MSCTVHNTIHTKLNLKKRKKTFQVHLDQTSLLSCVFNYQMNVTGKGAHIQYELFVTIYC